VPDEPVPSPFVKVTNERGEALELPSGRVYPPGGRIRIETDRYRAAVATEGYVSGVAAGSFLDKQTGARDLGFGLSIVDFLLEPAPKGEPVPEGQYEFGNLFHGNLPKRYVEGPQICTMAKRLPATVTVSPGFASVRLNYRWNIAYPPRDRAGSVWEQTLVFPRGERFFLSADRVTTVSESPELFYRVDMPGHIRHGGEIGFEHVESGGVPLLPRPLVIVRVGVDADDLVTGALKRLREVRTDETCRSRNHVLHFSTIPYTRACPTR